ISPPAPAQERDANMTLMFTPDDMEVIAKMIKVYDSYDVHKQNTTQKEDYSDIFNSVKPEAKEGEPVHEVIKRLPNLYLGSIVYYSPSNWAVTINGNKIRATDNAPSKELYITKISRKEIELVWKPKSLNDLPEKWNEVTNNGKNPVPNVAVD